VPLHVVARKIAAFPRLPGLRLAAQYSQGRPSQSHRSPMVVLTCVTLNGQRRTRRPPAARSRSTSSRVDQSIPHSQTARHRARGLLRAERRRRRGEPLSSRTSSTKGSHGWRQRYGARSLSDEEREMSRKGSRFMAWLFTLNRSTGGRVACPDHRSSTLGEPGGREPRGTNASNSGESS